MHVKSFARLLKYLLQSKENNKLMILKIIQIMIEYFRVVFQNVYEKSIPRVWRCQGETLLWKTNYGAKIVCLAHFE